MEEDHFESKEMPKKYDKRILLRVSKVLFSTKNISSFGFLVIAWIFLLSFELPNTNAKLVPYEWNVCWELPLPDESLFWYDGIYWNISETV